MQIVLQILVHNLFSQHMTETTVNKKLISAHTQTTLNIVNTEVSPICLTCEQTSEFSFSTLENETLVRIFPI